MTQVVIDTNVMVVANHQNGLAVKTCVSACIQYLVHAREKCVVLLDDADQVRAEYAGALSQGRPYQVGAQFLMHIYQNQFNEKHVLRVQLETDPEGGYVAFPAADELQDFDPSDRKFAALAVVAGVPVTNAVDSDWALSLAALEANGIKVNFLCGADPSEWFEAI